MPEFTPNGVPIALCDTCGREHPTGKRLCIVCGKPSAFINDAGFCLSAVCQRGAK